MSVNASSLILLRMDIIIKLGIVWISSTYIWLSVVKCFLIQDYLPFSEQSALCQLSWNDRSPSWPWSVCPWVNVANSLVNNHPGGERSHFGCEWKRGLFETLLFLLGCDDTELPGLINSQQRLSSRRKVEQPGLCLTLLEMSAGLRLQNALLPLHLPHCARAINHYQLLISSNDFEEKNISIYALLVSLRFAGEKQKKRISFLFVAF